jgi:hypothetical protein
VSGSGEGEERICTTRKEELAHRLYGRGGNDLTVPERIRKGAYRRGARHVPSLQPAIPFARVCHGFPLLRLALSHRSRPLAVALAADAAFQDFYATARARNDNGTKCTKPRQCAAQPGTGRNLFKWPVCTKPARCTAQPIQGIVP